MEDDSGELYRVAAAVQNGQCPSRMVSRGKQQSWPPCHHLNQLSCSGQTSSVEELSSFSHHHFPTSNGFPPHRLLRVLKCTFKPYGRTSWGTKILWTGRNLLLPCHHLFWSQFILWKQLFPFKNSHKSSLACFPVSSFIDLERATYGHTGNVQD